MKIFKSSVLLSICLVGSTTRLSAIEITHKSIRTTFNNAVRDAYDRTTVGLSSHRAKAAFIGGTIATVTVNHFFGEHINNLFKRAYNKVSSYFKNRPLYDLNKIEDIIYKIEKKKLELE